jgi:aerobic carbon-monoxide dehydrogenase small subunit
VETVEGLAPGKALTPLQRCFLEKGGAQCGICTPGMLMTATAHLKKGGSREPGALREALAGNLCRCTGYQPIIDSIAAVKGAKK